MLAPDRTRKILATTLSVHAFCEMRKTVLHNDKLGSQIK